VTLLGDAAHPLLPYGSQGATQAIMDAEALGICYADAMEAGTGVAGCVKAYSDMRCEVSGKVVIANRDMGSTAVLRVVNQECKGMTLEDKRKWCQEKGKELHERIAAGTADHGEVSAIVDKDSKCVSDLEIAESNLELITTTYSSIADMCTHAKENGGSKEIQEALRAAMWAHWDKKSGGESVLYGIQKDCAGPETKLGKAPPPSECDGDTGKACGLPKLLQCQMFFDGATCSADYKCTCPPGFRGYRGTCESCGPPPVLSARSPKEL